MSRSRRVATVVATIALGVGLLRLWADLVERESRSVQSGEAGGGSWRWLLPFICGWMSIAGCLLWGILRAKTSRRELVGIIAFAIWVALGLVELAASMMAFTNVPV